MASDSYANKIAQLASSPNPNPYGYPMGPYKGFAQFGNVDPINRPVLNNPDGSYSTASTSTRYDPRDGTAVIFPTVINGQRLNEEQAWQNYLQTGQHMGKFNVAPPGSPEPQNKEAWKPSDAYAQGVHNWQASHYDSKGNRR